nr:cell wall hydrolase [Novosphingobium sp. B-7]
MTMPLPNMFAARPHLLDEFPWLSPSRRLRRKARALRYGRAAVIITLLAAPQFHNIRFATPPSRGTATSPPSFITPKAPVIDAPFAPKSLRALSTQDAELWNAKVPGDPFASHPASPLALSPQSATFPRSLECLAAAVYYEAGNEPLDGQRAVAQVVLNRVRHPEYPHSVCGVVFQGSERKTGCQFSFTCDGSLQRKPNASAWREAEGVAAAALQGAVFAPVGWSTHYHANYVVPYWAQSMQKLVTIGRHIFYRWNGPVGDGASFASRALPQEPDISPLTPPTSETLVAAPSVEGGARVTASERPIIAAQATDRRIQELSSVAAPEAALPPAAAARATVGSAATSSTALANRWIIGAAPKP